MTETKAAIAALALVLVVPVQRAGAQLVSKLEAGALTSTRDGALPENVFRIRPAVEFDLPLVALSASGSAFRTRESWQFGGGHAAATLSTPDAFGLVRGEISGSANRIAYDGSIHSDQFDARARVHMRFGRGGIWIGGGLDRPIHVPVVSSVEVTGGGAWTRVGRATVSGTITSFFFTKVASSRDSLGAITCTATTEQVSGPGLDQGVKASLAVDPAGGTNAVPSECRRESRFSDIEGALEWSVGPIEVAAQGGYRLGGSYDVTPESRRWAAATATYWLSGQLAAVIGGGRQPANPARGLPARSYANLGVMLAYWPIPKRRVPVASSASAVVSFDIRDAGASQQTLVVRVGGVERVEVMGDFTAWEPKLLTRIGRDRWEITLPITPGIHQINIRVDNGKWRPPPGTPTMRDGYSGEVGILVVN